MTRVLRTRAELRAELAGAPRPVGLVPTMGWLHDGHRALMQRARADDATTVVSIFVNPRQFNDDADFNRYPRNEARDLEICEAEGVDIVWAPPVEEVYVPGFDTVVHVGAIAEPLEGAARPGHFDGVATVVAILFGVVGADRAYFGQKDAQQVMVIRRMALDLALPTEVITCPTIREPDGLALSSRNVHLTPEQRAAAPVLRRALLAAAAEHSAGERSADALRMRMLATIGSESLAEVDYVSVADGATLAELDRITGPVLLSLAVRFGSTRLIDNEPLSETKDPVPTRVPQGDLERIQRFCRARVPAHVANVYRLEVDVQGHVVTLFARRPPSSTTMGPEWSRNPVARLRHFASRGAWGLYWADRNGRWHEYRYVDPSPDVGVLLDEIDADPTGIFWG